MDTSAPVSVAIIIPVYNGCNYLAEALRSVLSQTAPASEIFVIDDGSTDSSADLARSFGPAITVIQRTNHGLSASRNYAAALATADWLAFLDHDDVYYPENLARQTAAIACQPDADVSYCGRTLLYAVPGTNTFVERPAPPVPLADTVSAVLLERCPFTPCSVMIKRSSFFAAGQFDSQFDGAEDWEFFLRIRALGATFVASPEPLSKYRVHPTSLSHNALRMLKLYIKLIDRNIFPEMTPLQRLFLGRKLKSHYIAEAAILMREQQTPGFRAMMLRSILHHPFHSMRRYKIGTHMMLHGTQESASPESTQSSTLQKI